MAAAECKDTSIAQLSNGSRRLREAYRQGIEIANIRLLFAKGCGIPLVLAGLGRQPSHFCLELL
jgi:hypothetical protein